MATLMQLSILSLILWPVRVQFVVGVGEDGRQQSRSGENRFQSFFESSCRVPRRVRGRARSRLRMDTAAFWWREGLHLDEKSIAGIREIHEERAQEGV